MAYYPDWVADTFPPQKIDFHRFDWIDFAFAVPTLDLGLEWDDPRAPDSLHDLVMAAHAHEKKVKLSIGGWTGSRYFSNAVSTEDNRRRFSENIRTLYTAYDLDGIDIDWEYPGAKGANGNTWNVKDGANFLIFLQMLRVVLPIDARITAAVATMPFIGEDGKPMSNVTPFAKVLDWVLIMNYDVWGSSSKPGPNAPLRDGCGNSTQPDSSAAAAFTAWTSAGFPACQLVLGLPSYGYISSSTASRLRTRATATSKPKKAKPNLAGVDNIMNEDGATQGQIQYKDLIKEGVLKRSNSTHLDGQTSTIFTGANGFVRHWDSCSDTPFLRSHSTRQVVTYDDPESLSLKGAFAREAGMLGVNIFDVHGDTGDWELTDAVRKALGLVDQ
ncbi:glycoside hydrolase family 18 protein [Crepidotus variabilis]|uniref:Glycoside hydrolase family 18 protein n=1 Tax=Crepidotus variabilis TaxID=179855 RepID=A0A9P6JW61_9AGAR|nr:glycoside hydrolase family 18 protein [Crepidotus variabilis]